MIRRVLAYASLPSLLAAGNMSDPTPPPVIELPPMVVTATRTPQATATLPVTVDLFTTDDLRNSPAEMYAQGVTTRMVRAVTEELCGHGLSANTVSAATKQLDEELERVMNQPLTVTDFMAEVEKLVGRQ